MWADKICELWAKELHDMKFKPRLYKVSSWADMYESFENDGLDVWVSLSDI